MALFNIQQLLFLALFAPDVHIFTADGIYQSEENTKWIYLDSPAEVKEFGYSTDDDRFPDFLVHNDVHPAVVILTFYQDENYLCCDSNERIVVRYTDDRSGYQEECEVCWKSNDDVLEPKKVNIPYVGTNQLEHELHALPPIRVFLDAPQAQEKGIDVRISAEVRQDETTINVFKEYPVKQSSVCPVSKETGPHKVPVPAIKIVKYSSIMVGALCICPFVIIFIFAYICYDTCRSEQDDLPSIQQVVMPDAADNDAPDAQQQQQQIQPPAEEVIELQPMPSTSRNSDSSSPQAKQDKKDSLSPQPNTSGARPDSRQPKTPFENPGSPSSQASTSPAEPASKGKRRSPRKKPSGPRQASTSRAKSASRSRQPSTSHIPAPKAKRDKIHAEDAGRRRRRSGAKAADVQSHGSTSEDEHAPLNK